MLIERSDEFRIILTSREIEILQLMAEGKDGRQIAIEVDISHQHLKNLRIILYIKLDATCAAHAVAQAFREGIIE